MTTIITATLVVAAISILAYKLRETIKRFDSFVDDYMSLEEMKANLVESQLNAMIKNRTGIGALADYLDVVIESKETEDEISMRVVKRRKNKVGRPKKK